MPAQMPIVPESSAVLAGPEGGQTNIVPVDFVAQAMYHIGHLPDAELLKYEKELLGFYITSHPLTEHEAKLQNFSTASTKEAMNLAEGTEVLIGCMLSAVRSKVAKSGRSAGQRWAIIELEDLETPPSAFEEQ